jgi:hypothetical protein
MKTKPILAWHWAKRDLKTQHTDEPIVVGGTLSAVGILDLCHVGMHASLCPLDALQCAPGSMLCRVELSGEIIEGDDKLCARHRKVVAIYDADHMLHEFACLCAERALKQAGVTDERGHNAIKVKRLWLAGKATDEEMAAARDAARAAAWDAAWDAARDAARDAAWAAAWDAARDAAWDAARDAARDAEWDAARDAEIKWQRATLNKLIRKLKPITT